MHYLLNSLKRHFIYPIQEALYKNDNQAKLKRKEKARDQG
jgi:hypothetical protein